MQTKSQSENLAGELGTPTRKYEFNIRMNVRLTFRHRASSILGQAFRYSPENAFYIFNQQIYFIF